MKLLLLLPLLLGFSVPAIAHNEANGGAGSHSEPESTGVGIEVPEGHPTIEPLPMPEE